MMEKEQSGKTLFRGELALVIAVLVNSFGVVLMLYSGAGISAISSVPYAFSLAFPALTLGTWTYLLICFGIALSNRCGLPIVPTDLFPRELADITKVPYPRIKIGFDVTCLAITAGMTFFFLGRLEGLGIGTIAAAFTMGKGIGLVGDLLDKHFYFENYKTLRNAKNKQ